MRVQEDARTEVPIPSHLASGQVHVVPDNPADWEAQTTGELAKVDANLMHAARENSDPDERVIAEPVVAACAVRTTLIAVVIITPLAKGRYSLISSQ